MKIDYQDCLDPRIEVIALLEQHFTPRKEGPKSVMTEMERICNTYGIPPSDLQTLVEPIAQLEKYVLEHISAPEETLEFLFAPCNMNASLAWHLLLDDIMRENGEPARRLSTQDEIFKEIAAIAAVNAEMELPEQLSLGCVEDLARYLETIETPGQDKWKYLTLCMHFTEYEKKAWEIVTEGARYFTQGLPEELRARYAAVTQENRANFTAGFSKLLQSSIQSYTVLPCLMSYYAVRFSVGKEQAVILVGVYYWILDALIKKYASGGDRLLERLKTISDKSRLDILQLLKKESCCGQDIAEKLSLTPGTVSHHLNLLVRNGLIQVLKKGSRIQCQLDTAAVEALLWELRRTLLQ